jgi:hypothetical protein
MNNQSKTEKQNKGPQNRQAKTQRSRRETEHNEQTEKEQKSVRTETDHTGEGKRERRRTETITQTESKRSGPEDHQSLIAEQDDAEPEKTHGTTLLWLYIDVERVWIFGRKTCGA